MKNTERYFYLIYMVLGFLFLRSGIDKVSGGKFVGGLSGTLEKFASKNPYPFYKDFLNNVAIPNSVVFGNLTMWGEVLTGLSYVLASLYLMFNKKPVKSAYLLFSLGCLGGAFLNGTFWLAAGYTSPSTDSVNLVMFLVAVIGLIYGVKKYVGGKE